ncbi:hypothetical protein MMC24_001075 [Lignoscripta atroalba]|nr:hypothetical protein [Lignoscripta atroalba]
MKDEDLNLIFTLKPISERAVHVFSLEHNSSRYVRAALKQIAACRGVTPATNVGDSDEEDKTEAEDDVEEDFSSRLRFTFSQKPKDIKRGFVFGGSSSRCDVILGSPEDGISARHFKITLDDLGRLILESTSSVRTTVSYSGQAEKQSRSKFKWILFPKFHLKVKIKAINRRGRPKLGDLEFSIHVATHVSCKEAYEKLRNSYIEEARNATEEYQRGDSVLDLHLLDVHSQPTTAAGSEPRSPREGPIYIRRRRIGSGLSGTVYEGLDVSTGDTYALKDLRVDNPNLDWRREVDMMRSVSHEHLVEFVDFTEEVEPMLVMEYVDGGNLEDWSGRLTEHEIVIMLDHLLRGVEHLHRRGLVHRDIKPANILIRQPLHFMLCDFGLANFSYLLRTFCGTSLYVAPEVREGSCYTPAVDMWSLGVVVYQYIYGLPEVDLGLLEVDLQKRNIWYQTLIREINDWESDALIDFLSSSMLRYNANERLSASDCLKESSRLRHNIPIQNFEMQPGTPIEPMSSSARMGALRNAGYGTSTSGHTSNEHAQTNSVIWLPENEARIAKSSKQERLTARSDTDGLSDEVCQVIERPEIGDTSNREKKPLREDIECLDKPTKIWNAPADDLGIPKPDGRRRQPGSASCESVPTSPKRQRTGRSDVAGALGLREDPPGYIKMTVEGRAVHLRKSDYRLNLTQIIVLAGKDIKELRRIHSLMQRHVKVQLQETTAAGLAYGQYWVPYHHGLRICEVLHLKDALGPLLEYGQKLGASFDEQDGDLHYIDSYFQGFFNVNTGKTIVSVRVVDLWVNATHVVKEAGHTGREIERLRSHGQIKQGEAVRSGPKWAYGTYVCPATVLSLCDIYGLGEFKQLLLKTLEERGYKREDARQVAITANAPATSGTEQGICTGPPGIQPEEPAVDLPDTLSLKWPDYEDGSPSAKTGPHQKSEDGPDPSSYITEWDGSFLRPFRQSFLAPNS